MCQEILQPIIPIISIFKPKSDFDPLERTIGKKEFWYVCIFLPHYSFRCMKYRLRLGHIRSRFNHNHDNIHLKPRYVFPASRWWYSLPCAWPATPDYLGDCPSKPQWHQRSAAYQWRVTNDCTLCEFWKSTPVTHAAGNERSLIPECFYGKGIDTGIKNSLQIGLRTRFFNSFQSTTQFAFMKECSRWQCTLNCIQGHLIFGHIVTLPCSCAFQSMGHFCANGPLEF